VCGEPFLNTRKNAKFCSHSCNTKSVWTGRKKSDVHRAKIAATLTIGDGTGYCDGWKVLREEYKEYDDNECQNPTCKGVSERMTSHHIDYDKSNCHPDNIITLCNSCNLRANHNRGQWKEFYMDLKRRK
jgi:hypothetical protein